MNPKTLYSRNKLVIRSKDFKIDTSFSTRGSVTTDDGQCISKKNDPSETCSNESQDEQTQHFLHSKDAYSQSKTKKNKPKLVRNQSVFIEILLNNNQQNDLYEPRSSRLKTTEVEDKKFKTELCKNFNLLGFCEWGISVI